MNWNAYRGRGALFLRFVSITNGRGGGGGGGEVSCAQWKTDSQAGFNSFHRAADFRQCRHSTGISTTQTLVPPFRSPPRPFQHGNRFPPKRAFACHRPPNEHGPFQPPPPLFKTAKTVIRSKWCSSDALSPSSSVSLSPFSLPLHETNSQPWGIFVERFPEDLPEDPSN